MNKKDLKQFEQILTSLRNRIAGEYKQIEEENLSTTSKDRQGDVSAFSTHMADMAADEEILNRNVLFFEQEGDILEKIDQSLAKIKDGTYGICDGCGKPINRPRLLAKPFAQYCIPCRQEYEENH